MTAERSQPKSGLELGGYAIATLPIFIYWLSWAVNRNYWFTTDPAAWYFLDSLAIFTGKTYVYVDHPGTPVHVIGSILLGITYPFFANKEAFIRYYLAEPETFFAMANAFLLAANVLTIIVLYRTVSSSLKHDKIIAAIALSLMYFAIHPNAFSSLTYWSHNSFNFIFGTLWLLWLYHELQSDQALERKTIILLGLTVGALITTQLYLLPWLIGGIITVFTYSLRRSNQLNRAIVDALIFLASSLSGILILLLPIYRELPRFLDWLARLIGREGLYGAGATNVYSPGLLTASLRFWWQHIPLVMLTLIIAVGTLGIVVWLVRSKPVSFIPTGDFALTIGLVSQTLLLILVLSKMFYRIRYVLALAAILPILILLALKLLEQLNWRRTILTRVMYAALIICALFFMSTEIQSQLKKTVIEREFVSDYSRVISRLAKRSNISPKEIVTVYASATPGKCAGLLLANNWIRAFDRELEKECPNQHAIYDFAYEVQLNIPYPVASIEEIDWDLVVWPGNGSNLPDYLASAGAQTVPSTWHIKRGKWFYVHTDDL